MHDDTGEMIGTLLTFSPLGVFANATFLLKMVIIVIVGAGLAALIAAVKRRTSGGPPSSFLALMGRVGLYAGIAAAGYTGMTTYMTAQALHVTRFVVYEPEVLEAMYVLVLGVIVWLIARFGNKSSKLA